MVWSRLLLMVMVIAKGRGDNNHTIPDMQRLRDALLRGYDSETVPLNKTEAVIVTMSSLAIRNIVMDEELQNVKLHAWLGFIWNDDRLLWDPEDYGGIRKMTFNPRDLWMPDLSLYSAAEAKDVPIVVRNRLVVSPDFGVLMVTPLDTPSSCVTNLKYWPADTQECTLKLGSWVHDGYTIDLRVQEGIKVEMEVTESPDGTLDTMAWRIDDSSITREEKFYDCCQEPYYNVQVTLQLSRKTPFFTWIMKVPALCLIVVTTVLFALPPGAGHKITFGGLCLLLNLVFLIFTKNTIGNAPTHTPLLVELVVAQLAVTAASVLVAAWVVRAAQQPYISPPSSFICSFTGSVAPYLGLSAYVTQYQGQSGGLVKLKGEVVDTFSEGKHGQSKEQWLLFGAVFDRFALILHLVVCFIMLLFYMFAI